MIDKEELLFQKLLDKIQQYLNKDEIIFLQKAYSVAKNAHAFQKRKDGSNYITHPIEVASILSEFKLDYKTITTGLLHDVLEDTTISKKQLIDLFDEEIYFMVDSVSKIKQTSFKNKQEIQIQTLQKMLLAISSDYRIIFVKLADRLHNMRTIGSMRYAKQKRIATETLKIYIPLCRRLGIYKMWIELEDLCFKAIYPKRYQILKNSIEKIKKERKTSLDEIKTKIEQSLQNKKILFRIELNTKNLYSIYLKMKMKKQNFYELMNIFNLKILVDNLDNAYITLGIVHSLFKPNLSKFKDYISIPRINGYQALHTTIFGTKSINLEIQILTSHLNEYAENGISFYLNEKNNNKWINSLIDIEKHSDNLKDFFDNIQTELFYDKIYVFSIDGNIIELPLKSTALDFAYAISSDLGDHSAACYINKRLNPLSHKLRNGDIVEIITSKDKTTNEDWLSFIITGKAKAHILYNLKHQNKKNLIEKGYRLLEEQLQKHNLTISDINTKNFQEILNYHKLISLSDLLENIGNESIDFKNIIKFILDNTY